MKLKQVTCQIHGLNLRPEVCSDCCHAANSGMDLRVLRIEDQDRNRLELDRDDRGNVRLSLVGQPLDTSRVPLFWD